MSHSQLLIRSPKRSDEDVNIDLIFTGVEYVSLPSIFQTNGELILAEGDEADLRSFTALVSASYPERRVFWITNDGRRFAVIAAWCGVRETNHELLESGLVRTFT